MQARLWRRLSAVVILGWAVLASPASAQHCDRECLASMITTYVDALVAHDPSALPLAETVKVTEDGNVAQLGDGLWQSVTSAPGFRQDYLDTAKQVAATHVELREGETPVLLSLALHIEAGKIAGIETLVQRITPESPFQPKELGAPIRGMNDPVPPGEAMNRADLVDIALTYTEGLRVGNFRDGGTPFAPDTYRVENGVVTAGGGCGRDDCGMYAQRLIVHAEILPSVVAVDEEAGIVLLWMNFGDTGSYGEDTALIAYEAFKIWGGQIHSINAFFTFLPHNRSRFWDSTDRTPRVY